MNTAAHARSRITLSPLDRVVVEFDACLRTLSGVLDAPARPSPATLEGAADATTPPVGQREAPGDAATRQDPAMESEATRRHVAGLMRVNHAGEVAAQALYRGQALTARSGELGQRLDAARREEIDHLVWCEGRLRELGSRTSRFGAVWYGGAFALGALAGAAGDRVSLGFLAETERQVTEHLDHHLARLPEGDNRSRRVLSVMREEEDAHRAFAERNGGLPLPQAVRTGMRLTAAVMKWIAYRV